MYDDEEELTLLSKPESYIVEINKKFCNTPGGGATLLHGGATFLHPPSAEGGCYSRRMNSIVQLNLMVVVLMLDNTQLFGQQQLAGLTYWTLGLLPG